MTPNWYSGNAVDDGAATRGWLLGHFIDPANGPRSTTDLEVKWGIHPAGDKRAEWTADDTRTTMVILVSGRFTVDLSVESVALRRQGDYLLWGAGIDHSWHAEEESTVITVRWPSLPPPTAEP